MWYIPCWGPTRRTAIRLQAMDGGDATDNWIVFCSTDQIWPPNTVRKKGNDGEETRENVYGTRKVQQGCCQPLYQKFWIWTTAKNSSQSIESFKGMSKSSSTILKLVGFHGSINTQQWPGTLPSPPPFLAFTDFLHLIVLLTWLSFLNTLCFLHWCSLRQELLLLHTFSPEQLTTRTLTRQALMVILLHGHHF